MNPLRNRIPAPVVWQTLERASGDSRWVRWLLVFIVLTWMLSFAFDYYLSLTILSYVGLLAALVGLFHPSVGLVGTGMLCTVDAVTRSLLLSGGLMRYNTMNYMFLLAIVIGLPLLERLKDPQTRLLQALAGVLVLGLLIMRDPVAGFQHALNVVAIFGLLVFFLRARHVPRALYNVALVNGVLAGVGGLVFFSQINRLPWLTPDSEDRFMNANAFAFFPLSGIFSICLAYPSATPKEQTRLGILALMTLFSVFLSGSRNAIILGLISLVYLVIVTSGVSRRLVYLLSVPILALTAITLFPSLQEYAVNRFLKLFDPRFSMASRTSGRSDIAVVGLGIFAKHPLGVGTGGFSLAYLEGDTDEMAFAGLAKQAHSGWIKTLVENGILGVLILASYVFSFAVTGRRTRHRTLRWLGLFVTVTLGVAFVGAEFQSKGLWFLACGATVLLNYRMAGQDQQSSIRIVKR